MAITSIDLFDGIGGNDLAFRHAGLPVRTVCRVERDGFAQATLLARMEEQALDWCPVWDSAELFAGAPWRGKVDLVTAGMPCQGFSYAGQMRGVDDDRWGWPSVARVVADVRPSLVFLENTPGIVRTGTPIILGDLAELGFDAEWGLLGAAAVGAPHQRDRWWLLAWRRDLAYADGVYRRQLSAKLASKQDEQQLLRLPPRGSFPPPPTAVDEWQRGIDEGSLPEPLARGAAHGASRRLVESVRACGNGIVPAAAGAAFLSLCARSPVRWICDYVRRPVDS